MFLGGRGVGVDPNTAAVDAAIARGVAAYTPDELLARPEITGFDTLLCSHVLEHLDRDAAVEVLRTWLPRIRPGGRVVLICPQERGQSSDATHVRLMDEAALRDVCAGVRRRGRADHVVPVAAPVRPLVGAQRDRAPRDRATCSPRRMSPSPPTVGLAIPYWSHPHYLAELLATVVAQTDRDFVAVVVDDCSPVGGAREAVEALGDPRVRYLRNERNLGLAGNFNRCLAEPGTDVVAIVHADDLLEPGYVATIRAGHADAPHAACVAPWTTPIDARGNVAMSLVDRLKHHRWPAEQRSELTGDAGLARLVHTFFVYTPAMSYRPALLPAGGFPDGWQQVMDVELYASLLLDGGTILLDRTPVVPVPAPPGHGDHARTPARSPGSPRRPRCAGASPTRRDVAGGRARAARRGCGGRSD